MAEKLHKPEAQGNKHEHTVEHEHLPDIERLNKEALEKASEVVKVEELKDQVQEKAKSTKETAIEDKPAAVKHEFAAYTELKGQTYDRTLKRVQQRLSSPERAMSKVMHNKTVEKVSDGLGKTAARPSGILGGGIVCFLGSCVLLYMTKKYGFEYNLVMFFVFLVAGFTLGVVLEFLLYAVKKARN